MLLFLRFLTAIVIFVGARVAEAQFSCDGYPPGTETTIAVYTNLEGTSCAGETSAGMLTGSIWVNLAGAAAGGITGAEYRILAGEIPGDEFYSNGPPLFSIYFYPNPDAVLNFGDPFHGGTNTVFDTCRSAPRVRIGTFLMIEAAPEPITLYVSEHESPSNYTFCCPLVTLCDGPVFTKVCVTGISKDSHHWNFRDYDLPVGALFPDGELFFAGVNWENEYPFGAGRCPILSFDTTTGMAAATWSTVKSLYR